MSIGVTGHLPDAFLEGGQCVVVTAGPELFQAPGKMEFGGFELPPCLLKGFVFFCAKRQVEKERKDKAAADKKANFPCRTAEPGYAGRRYVIRWGWFFAGYDHRPLFLLFLRKQAACQLRNPVPGRKQQKALHP
jgi:hypothetical protein